jgi:hypothetical protein
MTPTTHNQAAFLADLATDMLAKPGLTPEERSLLQRSMGLVEPILNQPEWQPIHAGCEAGCYYVHLSPAATFATLKQITDMGYKPITNTLEGFRTGVYVKKKVIE